MTSTAIRTVTSNQVHSSGAARRVPRRPDRRPACPIVSGPRLADYLLRDRSSRRPRTSSTPARPRARASRATRRAGTLDGTCNRLQRQFRSNEVCPQLRALSIAPARSSASSLPHCTPSRRRPGALPQAEILMSATPEAKALDGAQRPLQGYLPHRYPDCWSPKSLASRATRGRALTPASGFPPTHRTRDPDAGPHHGQHPVVFDQATTWALAGDATYRRARC